MIMTFPVALRALMPVLGAPCPVNGETPEEEFANAVTHGAGTLLSLVGSLYLLYSCWFYGTSGQFVAGLVYTLNLCLLFLTSTIYHLCKDLPRKAYLRILDHCMIFMVIAGTYTPYLTITLGDARALLLLLLVWLIAAVGCLYKHKSPNPYGVRSVTAYCVHALLVFLVIDGLTASAPAECVRWLLHGGVCYMVGIGIYAWTRLPFNHALWHLCVVAGSIYHYFSVLLAATPS